MGLFSRRRDDTAASTTSGRRARTSSASTPARSAAAGAEAGARSRKAGSAGTAGGAAHGPWDQASLPASQESVTRLDLGALRIPAVDGMQLRLEQSAQDGITAVVLALGGSALELRAFAAPKTAGIWQELREDIARELSGARARYEEVDGEHGTEILAHIPMRAPDGTTSTGTVRFIGIDGPRWFLRGVLQGPAAASEETSTPLREVLRGIVVVRDSQARPPREILPLH
ncbi:DUF3710 domain-containing protein, partial [Actinomyces slackii]